MEKIRPNGTRIALTRHKSYAWFGLSNICLRLHVWKMFSARRIALFFVMIFTIFGFGYYYFLNASSSEYDANTWLCLNETCISCLKMNVPPIHLNSTVCTNIKYLAEDIGVKFTILDITRDISINKTLPAQGLLMLQLQEPFVEKPGEIHVYFESVRVTPFYLWACGIVEARKQFLFLQEFKLGCFNISSSSRRSNK